MKLCIKNMVSSRCKSVVTEELKKFGFQKFSVGLGEAIVKESVSDFQLRQLKLILKQSGLELMEDKKTILIEKIKNIVIEMIHHTNDLPKVNFSDYLSEKLKYDYTYMANMFSEAEGTTIEHYLILHKIERVKELILYNELNLTEIAWNLHYSSVAHLSNQFKKITGFTPTFFKSLKHKRRKMLEDV